MHKTTLPSLALVTVLPLLAYAVSCAGPSGRSSTAAGTGNSSSQRPVSPLDPNYEWSIDVALELAGISGRVPSRREIEPASEEPLWFTAWNVYGCAGRDFGLDALGRLMRAKREDALERVRFVDDQGVPYDVDMYLRASSGSGQEGELNVLRLQFRVDGAAEQRFVEAIVPWSYRNWWPLDTVTTSAPLMPGYMVVLQTEAGSRGVSATIRHAQ